ncbi:MAG: transcriptional regulator [Sphingomonadaceae bacterium]|nr:transcriptional regulator [Sphingomonadaceae bacterium]
MRNTVKFHRTQLGLTQRELARHANCSRAYIIGLEAGKTPNLDTAFRIAQVFDKPVEAIFIPDWHRLKRPAAPATTPCKASRA